MKKGPQDQALEDHALEDQTLEDQALEDQALEKRLNLYDSWIQAGKIPSSSKIIPVHESLGVLQWVLPTQNAIEILRNSRSFALANCLCRTTHKRCDNPLEVCFYTNDVADKKVAQGSARHVDLQEAEQVLKLANAHGLIHLTIYNPDQHVHALCSCCHCCCHDIGFMTTLKRPDMVARADYIAVVDEGACVHCGKCIQRCLFGAHQLTSRRESRQESRPEFRQKSNVRVFHQDRCFGCGLCVTTCPVYAIEMVLRQ